MRQYPKSSKLYCCLPSYVNSESQIIKEFKKLYTHRKDIGNEYFEENFDILYEHMFKIIYSIDHKLMNMQIKNGYTV